MYGWRGKIGLILPSLNNTMEYELNKMKPEGVLILATRLLLEKGMPDNLEKMTEQIDQAADLLKTADIDCILFACTSGSFIKGVDWDKEFIQRIEKKTGIPTTTTVNSVVEVFELLQVKSISVVTPYIDDINEIERNFFEGLGFKVNCIEGLQCVTGEQLHRLPSTTAYELACRTCHPASNAIFISCTDFASIEVVDSLEKDTGKPVITSNTASLWAALRKIGVNESIYGYGEILTLL